MAEPAVDGRIDRAGAGAGEEGRFERSEFGARLEALREACAVPGRVVLVTGPAGAGKSILCDALLSQFDSAMGALSVSAHQPDALDHALKAILEIEGFEIEPGMSRDAMVELMGLRDTDSPESGRQCLLVVDDAGALPARDLELLVAQAAGSALTIVLAGPPNLVSTIEHLAGGTHLTWREIRVSGLSIGDVNAYLEWRSARESTRTEQGGAVPRTNDQGRDSRRRRRQVAQPGWLEQLTDRLRASGMLQTGALGPLGFPKRHLMILAALVGVLLLVYGVTRLAEDGTGPAGSAERVETIVMPPLPTPEGASGEVSGGASADRSAAGSTDVQQLDLPSAPATAAPESQAAARPIIARPALSDSPAATDSAELAGAPAAAAPARQPVPVSPPAAVRATPTQPAAAAPARVTGGGAARNADWISAQPAARFTVQLVSLSSAERAQAYIAQQPDPAQFATYRLLRNGQLFHVVVYGSFSSKAEADQATGRLPQSVGNVQPWVRPFGQVQESMRSTQQR